MTERLFVSSVQKELADERRAVHDFIHGDALLRRFFDVFLFEDLPASDRRTDDVYLEEVARSTIYLGLFGDNYGSTDAAGVSPTEREFDEATRCGKVRLIFVRGTDDGRRDPRMLTLIRKAGGQLIRKRVTDIADLTGSIYASLVEHLERTGRLRTRPFDAAACPGATVDDLSADLLDLFLARAQSQRGYVLGPGTPMPTALAHLDLLDGAEPSHAAVLLFGKKPQRFLPSSEVKCMHFHGKEVRKPIPSYQIFKGAVFELVDRAVDFVLSKLAATVGTRAESNQAPLTYEIPREAVSEAIVNAVAHRDYASNASVQVMLFADRLEVWNPGRLPITLSFEQLTRPHASIPRNPLIAEPMFLARYVEKAGSGILDMIALCREAGLPAPGFRQEGGEFVQTLWRPEPAEAPAEGTVQVTEQDTEQDTEQVEHAEEELSANVQRLLHVMTGELAARDIQRILGLKQREHFRASYLTPALAAGLIERTAPDNPTTRHQRYRLTEKGRAWLAAREQ
jgi:predicted HTH transcriptional regulator